MLTRDGVYLRPRIEPVSPAAEQLEREKYAGLRNALSATETDELRTDMDDLFEELDIELRRVDEYRYAVLNHSAAVQRLVGSGNILDVVEPLIGEDCHVIANTAWRNPAGRQITHGGRGWHRRMPTLAIDAGRDFLQIRYGRRDIAQRWRTSDRAHQLFDEAVTRAGENPRARTVVDLFDPSFYDG